MNESNIIKRSLEIFHILIQRATIGSVTLGINKQRKLILFTLNAEKFDKLHSYTICESFLDFDTFKISTETWANIIYIKWINGLKLKLNESLN